MQEVIRQMYELGKMPDGSIDGPLDDVVERWQDLTESIELPLTKEEAEVLIALFPEDDLFGLAWNMMQAVESVLPDVLSIAEYRNLVNRCESELWRETMLKRLDNWLKKTGSKDKE